MGPCINFSPKQRSNEARKDPLVQFCCVFKLLPFALIWHSVREQLQQSDISNECIHDHNMQRWKLAPENF